MLTGALVLCTFVLLLPKAITDARFTLIFGMLGFALAQMSVPAEYSPVDPRFLAVVAIVIRFVGDRVPGVSLKVPTRKYQVHTLVIIAICSLIGLSLCSMVWSQSVSRTAIYSASWLVAIVFFWQHLRSIGRSELIRLMRWFLGVTVAACVVALVAGFQGAWIAGRAAGLMTNANGLGLVCMLLVGMNFRLAPVRSILASILPIGVLLLTGSRASLLGVAVIVLWFVLHRPGLRILSIFAGPLVLLVTVDLFRSVSDVSGGAPLILRTNNSRGENWAIAWEAMLELPVGVGGGVYDGGAAANSYLALGADFGVVLAAILLLLYAGAYWRATGGDTAVRGLLLGGLANAIFEGWLFTGGSLYTAVLLALVLSSDRADNKLRRPATNGRNPVLSANRVVGLRSSA